MKRVATGSVSERYQTCNNFTCKNVNFDLIYPIFNIQIPPSKITRYEVHLPTDLISSYFVGWKVEHSTTP